MSDKLRKLIGEAYYINPDITEAHFPKPKTIQTEGWKMIKIDETSSSEEVLTKIKAEGCRPANIWELAQFKLDHPEEIRPYSWIVALGSKWFDGDYHCVPGLRVDSVGGFDWGLGFFENVWYDSGAFFSFCDPSLDPVTLKKSDSLTLSPLTKINEKYVHNPSGITAKVWIKDDQKSVRLKTSKNQREFIFDRSSVETIRKVGEAFISIASFIDKL